MYQKPSEELIKQLCDAEAQHAAGALQEAAELYRLVLGRYPEFALARTAYNLGIVLNDLQQYADAEAAFRQALALQPDFPEAELNLCFAMQEQGRFAEAIKGYGRLTSSLRTSTDARFNLACLQLLCGDFIHGWEGYELRFETLQPVARRHSSIPSWDGIMSPGIRLLIHTEQGYGDAIQMVRYLPVLAGYGVDVHLETSATLAPLLSNTSGLKSCIVRGAEVPEVDFQVPIMSLPGLMATTLENIPGSVPYLMAEDDNVCFWRKLLPVSSRLRVGLAWAGRLDLPVNRKRSIFPSLLEPLLEIPDLLFVSLLKEAPDDYDTRDPRIFTCSGHLHDFHDTAALIANLDLVITIDTAVAHLSGAMGIPTWLLLPFVPDWRWLLDRNSSPWYPTMRLFRQNAQGDWGAVIVQVQRELQQLLHNDEYHLFQSGLTLLQNGKCSEAADQFRHLLTLAPARAEVWHNLGHACSTESHSDAEHAFRTARRLSPGDVGIACSLAEFYSSRERFEDALAIFNNVLELQPGNTNALAGAGHACQRLFRSEAAHDYYKRLLQHSPDDTDALNNLGVLYREAGDLSSSRNCFETILKRSPAEGDARWNLSHTLLIAGDMEHGWDEYEWRFSRTSQLPLPRLAIPRWEGEPLSGRTILLWTEQAYGDTFQFIRYADLLNKSGARVIVVAQDSRIAPLLATSAGVDAVVLRDQPLPQTDFWIPLLSLPRLFGTIIGTIPTPIPYLNPPIGLYEKWQQLIPAADGLRIGLVWAGRSRPDPRRSCPARELLPMASFSTRCRWYSLQVGADPEQLEILTSGLPLVDLAPLLTDFGETAAALCSLDLVITIDTSVAHLAGALGVPTWLMLPFAPDWRWLLGRDDSPWYPSMRIFRQPVPGDWAAVVSQLSEALNASCTDEAAGCIELPKQVRLLDGSDRARHDERWQDSFNLCLALLAETPLHPLALLQAGGCLLFLRQPLSARRFLEKALLRDPEQVDAHINLALACLTTGDYATGWKEFEWRLRKINVPLPPVPKLPVHGMPLETLRGATLLVHTEQGFGDTLQFVRYLPVLARLGVRIILSSPPSMTRLLASIEGIRQIAHGDILPVADYQTFLLSTPLLMYETLPEPISATPYLTPPADLAACWAERLPVKGFMKVGLAWAGREMKQSGYRRSLSIHDFHPLLRQPGVIFVSLQNGPHAVDINLLDGVEVLDCSSEIRDFADTAAIIAGLDLVITIDTSVAHLAGALGKPVWVALLHSPDWRWGVEGEESVWYPSMRLFRQPVPGAWEPVIAEMATLLKGEVLIRQGHAYGHDGDRNLAIQAFREAAELTGHSASAWLNLGIYLRADGKTDEARCALLKAVETDPDYPEAWQNLALVHQALRALPEAYACFRRALSLRKDYPTARWNLGLLQLLLGEYQEGFKNLEARFETVAPVARLHQEIQRWDGSPLPGKSILIHAEQGYGDTIQFIRFVPLLVQMGGTVILEVQDASLQVLVSSLDESIQVIVRGETVPLVDLQAPLLSLPLLLGITIKTVSGKIPYLHADKNRIGRWKAPAVQDGLLRAGIAWKGRSTPDPGRSIPFSELAPLFMIPNIVWYSLQIDCDAAAVLPANVIDKTGQISDFSDTAAMIASLDVVVTIDSALAHLAGALGIPGIVMLQAVPDWRWGLDCDATLWYPSLRLVRQRSIGCWKNVVEVVAELLGLNVSEMKRVK